MSMDSEMVRILTVFTPTYNRGYILPQLYESLKKQTNQSFEWLIVDDGSTDNTKDIVEEWIKEKIIKIRYIYQENAGKMQAHNRGTKECKTELFICVDSDDYLTDTAVEELTNLWENAEKDEKICGIVAKRGGTFVRQIGRGEFPDKKTGSLYSLELNGFQGDTTLCFRTSVIKKYQFPFIPGEKYISEGYIYDQIDYEGYEYLIYPKILTICKYLEDGYTQNSGIHAYMNPVGRMYCEGQRLRMSYDLKRKMRHAAVYNQYKIISSHDDVMEFHFADKVLLAFTYPVSFISAMMKNKKYKEQIDV